MADALGRYLSFESVAADYDRTRVIPGPMLEEITRVLEREAQLRRGGLFLDAGVGTGRFAVPLAGRYAGQIVGLDVSPAMLAQARAKARPGALSLAEADLRRLPFRSCVFAGALLVHILHLIEQWPLVLREIRRTLVPRTGLLFLGGEQGGRSLLVDFYYERARARNVLTQSLGPAGVAPALTHLRRSEREGGGGAQVLLLDTPHLAWRRTAPVAQTLEALAARTYSQTWDVPDAVHQELLEETREYARRTFLRPNAAETLNARFVLHKVWWP